MREGQVVSHQPLFVSVILPCRNEEQFIAACLDSIIANDYSKDHLEVLVIDGASEDRTRPIVESFGKRHPFIKLLNNSYNSFTAGANIGVRNAKGDAIMIIGAHATYSSNYISGCVKALQESGADNVGGILVPAPSATTAIARAIALVLAHPFGAGNSHFKLGSTKKRWVDTVFGGCYTRAVFEKVGLLDERLPRSSDMDFNIRLRTAGGKILLVPDIVVHYHPKSTLVAFAVHNFDDGLWTFYPLRYGSRTFYLRHTVPMVFISTLLVGLALAPFLEASRWLLIGIAGMYSLASLLASIHISFGKRRSSYLVLLPIVFAVRHVAYGTGALVGWLMALTGRELVTPRCNRNSGVESVESRQTSH
jgi:glycosyltransferase involved in cell wall biosynthesis